MSLKIAYNSPFGTSRPASLRVKKAFDRLAKEPDRLPDAKQFPSDPNTLLLRVSPELRLIYRYEKPQNGPMHIVVEDIVSRRTLERFAEQSAS